MQKTMFKQWTIKASKVLDNSDSVKYITEDNKVWRLPMNGLVRPSTLIGGVKRIYDDNLLMEFTQDPYSLRARAEVKLPDNYK